MIELEEKTKEFLTRLVEIEVELHNLDCEKDKLTRSVDAFIWANSPYSSLDEVDIHGLKVTVLGMSGYRIMATGIQYNFSGTLKHDPNMINFSEVVYFNKILGV